jgi:antitoxin YobK
MLFMRRRQVLDEIAALLDRRRELEPEVYVYGPAPEDAIRGLEAAFGEPMPPSYRAFLSRFGGVSILDSSYSGIIDGRIEEGRGWVWSDTLTAREECHLAPHLLVVRPDEDGFKCLDFSRRTPDGECPVVYQWPFRPLPRQVAASYGAWLSEDLRHRIAALVSDA